MGVAIKDILEYNEIELSSISNKKVAFDSFNMIYQFLASIRQNDGQPLTDTKGNVTSHLKGLFNRCVYFKKNNIKAIFVFDGKAPKLKEKERENRLKKKLEAQEKYKQALELGEEDLKRYAQGTSNLTPEMVEESQELIRAFGFPIILAPSEGEAQAAQLVKEGKAFALSSQDFDSLLFGGKFLIRNLSVSSKRKIPGSSMYKDFPIEFYDLQKNLEKLKISRDELIIIAMLCGTDFNPGGIKGIGPKKALKLVQEYKDKWDELFKILDWYSYFTYPWIEVFNVFKKMPVEKDLDIHFEEISKQKIKEILMKRDFDEEMLDRSLKGIKTIKTLDNFF